jgi:beta-mannosidase
MFAFADGHPSVTWSVLDHERRPKAAFDVLRDACRPVIVVADRPPEVVQAGRKLALDVHVISDRRATVEGARITASAHWTGGDHSWRWAGEVPADSCTRVGTLQLVVPDAPGPFSIDLALESGADAATNRYTATIVP